MLYFAIENPKSVDGVLLRDSADDRIVARGAFVTDYAQVPNLVVQDGGRCEFGVKFLGVGTGTGSPRQEKG